MRNIITFSQVCNGKKGNIVVACVPKAPKVGKHRSTKLEPTRPRRLGSTCFLALAGRTLKGAAL